MNIQGQPQKYGHLIVAGGTIIALIGFFFLPYVTMSSTTSPSSSSPQVYSAIQAASIQGFIWLEALLAAGILLIALLLAYSHNPFGMSQVALDKQVQRGIYTVIGVGLVSLLLQYVLMTTIPGAIVGMFSSNSPSITTSISSSVKNVAMGYNTGSWFYLVGMLAVIGGAVYALRAVRPAYAAQGQPSSYIPPTQYSQMNQQNQQNQQMPWQQPPSASPYQQNWQQPSAQPQPPQSAWQAPQEQYPPTQQAWQQPQQPQPPTQNPPTERTWPQQPPQQPYPPYPPSSTGQ